MKEDLLPNLMHIRAFAHVAETGSISRASDSLFRAQSVVTRCIGEFEAHLGHALFERHPRGVRLTEPGRCILPRAQRILGELKNVARLLGFEPRTEPIFLYQKKRLQIFVCLCRTLSMRAAANHFQVTQPAISAALKALEAGCRVNLFERTTAGLQATQASQEILYPINRALNELQHLRTDLHALRGNVEGAVRVGALPLARTNILPEAIVQLTHRHPGIQVITNESPFEFLANELRAGDIDFIFGALRPAYSTADIQGLELFSEEMVLVARGGHPLLEVPPCPGDLASARWILPRANSPARTLINAWFAEAGIDDPDVVVESGDLATIRGLLRSSDMLAAVSAHQLEYEIASGEIRRLPVRLARTARPIGLMERTGCLHSPATLALLRSIREQIAASLPAPA